MLKIFLLIDYFTSPELKVDVAYPCHDYSRFHIEGLLHKQGGVAWPVEGV